MALYQPRPPPATDDIDALTVYLHEELQRVADAVAAGRFSTIRLDQLNSLDDLPRPRDGDMAYWTEAAVGNNQQGLYEWDQQSTQWKKL